MLQRPLRFLFDRAAALAGRTFGPQDNPFFNLGSLGWLFFWVVGASGIYLYIFFDTGITAAYESVESLTHQQWFAGGVMRSLHRYGSDALVVVMVLHLLREYAFDRLRGPRFFAWVSGVPLIWLTIICGVSGYWLVWDQLAQYIAIGTSEWLDALPIFGESIARNFLDSGALAERFFTLMVFIHIFLPLAMLIAMWIHVQRHAQPRLNPPRGLMYGTLAMLVVLSLLRPAVSQAPADLDIVTARVELDWFYLAGYPLLDRLSGMTLWILVLAATVLLGLLPWLPRGTKLKPAVVNLDNCNGCARCAEDCPYAAISMVARTDGAAYTQEASVDPDLCVSCGICAGSCPTSTPYRRASDLVPGIDLPDAPVAGLREQVIASAAGLQGQARLMVFGCSGPGRDPGQALAGPDTAVIGVPCVGALPPSFIDFVLSKRYADGVVLAACRDGDCHFSLGQRWTAERISGARDPQLRARVPRERVLLEGSGLATTSRRAKVEQFRGKLPRRSDDQP